MTMIIICTAVYIFLIVFELIPIYRNKEWKLFWIYSIILFITYTVTIAYSLGVSVPSPAGPIKNLVTAIFKVAK